MNPKRILGIMLITPLALTVAGVIGIEFVESTAPIGVKALFMFFLSACGGIYAIMESA